LNTTENITLAPLGPSTVTLPMTFDNTAAEPQWLVPTQTSAVRVAQTSSLPAMFDFTLVPGDPLLASANFGPGSLCQTSSSLLYDPPGGSVTAGFYIGEPSECGPFSGPAPAGTATIAAAAQTKAFDSTVTSTTGDFWAFSVNPTGSFSPITIQPGHSAQVSVIFTPSGAPGSKVRGNLYVDTLSDSIPPYKQESASEVTAIPYRYTIAKH
jgi:hypothetical protein